MGRDRPSGVVGVLLAAGASSRFGAPKQTLPFGGETLIERALDVLLSSPLDKVIVVLGANAAEVEPRVQRPRVRVVHNSKWQEGQSTSVKAAVDALPSNCEAVVFMPCDMPWVTPDVIANLIQSWHGSEKRIVVAAADERRGLPAVFAREFFGALQEVSGDQGGRSVVQAYPDRVLEVHVSPDVLFDIDTPAEYRTALLRYHSQRQKEQMQRLRSIRNLIIDMDGVLYHGNQAVPGLVPFFQFLHDKRIQYLLATNNSTLTAGRYTEKLSRMGVEVPPERILTSSIATAQYLKAHYPQRAHVYAAGESGLKEALQEAGFVLDEGQAAAVVAGLDRDVTYEKLKRATLLIRSGADFIGTNADKTLPVPEGQVPGAGSILAALEAATGLKPTVIGKPEPPLFELALKQLGASKEETAVIGDRLETDIAGAKRIGLFAILVLSGVSTRDEALAYPQLPDLIFQDVAELAREWV